MIRLLADWLVHAIALYLVSLIVPGIIVSSFWGALVAVIVIGLLNALIRPLLLLLTLPITILTLGLFTFVINAVVLLLAGSVYSGFRVEGLGSALVGSIVLSLVTTILFKLVK